MLFRIEYGSGFDQNLRLYNKNEFSPISISKDGFDNTIETMIRAGINGAKNRYIHSYSKSLAVCLLKYAIGNVLMED